MKHFRFHRFLQRSCTRVLQKTAMLTGMILSLLIGQMSGLTERPVQAAENLPAENSIAQSVTYEAPGIAAPDGLVMTKMVTPESDGSWLVTLESYVTGTEKKGVHPADIVLLMDVSGSMDYFPYEGAATRTEALQNAVDNFIDDIAVMNDGIPDKDRIRIAMAQFASEERSQILCGFTDTAGGGAAALKAQAASLKGTGVTRTDCGMGLARQLIEEDSAERPKYVILFTDGQPNNSDGFQPSVANRALESAKTLKREGAKIYVISIAPNSYAGNGGILPSYEKLPSDDGSDENFIYVSPSLTYDHGPAVNTTEENITAMTNRFMHLVSSNNPYAADMDLPNRKDANDPGRTAAEDGTNYYLTALDTEGLRAAFSSLAYSIGTSDTYLGPEAQMRDVVTDWFELEAASVTPYISDRVRNADGSFSWGERRPADNVTVKVLQDEKTISVKGFDYSGSYVSDHGHVDNPDYYGSRLICEFRLTRGKLIGGNKVPTNTEDSGIYQNRKLDTCIGTFPVPMADVPIDYGISSLDYAVYVPDRISLPDMLNFLPEHTPDGKNNAFVNIDYVMRDSKGQNVWAMSIPAGGKPSADSWKWNDPGVDHCEKYTIECTVTPVSDGTVPVWNDTVNATAHVYRPTITLLDTTKKYNTIADVMIGDSLSSAGLKNHFGKVVWKCDDDFPSRTENEPKLGFHVTPLSGIENEQGKFLIRTKDAAVLSVNVLRSTGRKLTDDITGETTFLHSCTRDDCTFDDIHAADGRARFLIHSDMTGTDDPNGGGKDTENTDPDPSDTAPDAGQTGGEPAGTGNTDADPGKTEGEYGTTGADPGKEGTDPANTDPTNTDSDQGKTENESGTDKPGSGSHTPDDSNLTPGSSTDKSDKETPGSDTDKSDSGKSGSGTSQPDGNAGQPNPGTGKNSSDTGTSNSGGSNTSGDNTSAGNSSGNGNNSGNGNQPGSGSGGAGNSGGSGSNGNSGSGGGTASAAGGKTSNASAAASDAARQAELARQQAALSEAYAAGVNDANSLWNSNLTAKGATPTAGGSGNAGTTPAGGANGSYGSGSASSTGSPSGTVQDRPRTGDSDEKRGWMLILIGALVVGGAYLANEGMRRHHE